MSIHQYNAPWMDEDHTLFAATIQRFLADECIPNETEWEKAGQVDHRLWKKAGDLGIMGAGIAEAYGGVGGDHGFDAIMAYQQGYSGAVGWGVSIQSIVKHYIDAFGTEQQKLKWLPKLISGEFIPAIAMTEPGAGSDLLAITTRAVQDDEEYVIDGSKTFITNGQQANLIVVAVKTNIRGNASDLSLIVVEAEGQKGLQRGRNLEKIGIKAQDTSELFFERMRVSRENLLGASEGKGFYQLMQQLPWERLIIGFFALGAADRAIDETTAFVRQRKAFGKRLLDLQNTRFKLAECRTKSEVTRAFLDRCLEQINVGELTAASASMAKWWSTQMQSEIIDECLQLHGGYGFMSEYPIAKLYTDARALKIYGGANEVMKELIARTIDMEGG